MFACRIRVAKTHRQSLWYDICIRSIIMPEFSTGWYETVSHTNETYKSLSIENGKYALTDTGDRIKERLNHIVIYRTKDPSLANLICGAPIHHSWYTKAEMDGLKKNICQECLKKLNAPAYQDILNGIADDFYVGELISSNFPENTYFNSGKKVQRMDSKYYDIEDE